MPHPGGRPRIYTEEVLGLIGSLRSRGVVWRDVGNALGQRPQGCRRAWLEARKGRKGAENSQTGQESAVAEA